MNKIAIISSFLGAIKNRYINYQEDRSLEEKFKIASAVTGLSGFELCYPQDFGDITLLQSLLKEYSLGVSAVNFRSRRTGQWMRGSFSSASKDERDEVVEDLKKAMDTAAAMGCGRITTCPLNEGHDYIFEMDYTRAYDYFEDSIARAAGHNPGIKISIEYKWNDPRARCFFGNAGETLAFCQRLDLDNVGVTLDFGHAIQAGERPAQSAAMLARANKLFYVHINDNDKIWDWDMLPGAYNFWDFIEFFYYLNRLGYKDWFAMDIFPKEADMASHFSTAVKVTEKLFDFSQKLDEKEISRLFEKRDPTLSMEYLYSLINMGAEK
ncbi:sugar phosphate isomerase/epimerase family protein [Breznakiella homolactica]|uniref:Sugar phosphate isomerase/epimerase n=1 Tax=Breznakiella homolactica TaxID=2798577 RepID=A0A7T7XKL1_9SPIR|nr:sugar phosphate isomerase/epimerase family protein [Breznakiella homolactica]QQO08124.1 sugar phosphate isomerase/epimerase [Breznakiella homolactica]